jgi:hypothetical protein
MSGWCVLLAGGLYLGEAVVLLNSGKQIESTMMLCYAVANLCLYAILAR